MDGVSLQKLYALEKDRVQQDKIIKEHRLRQLFWECTVRCNLNCLHCGCDCRVQSDISDMPLKDFLHVLDNVASVENPKDVFVVLTGGEPLLRTDLEQCGREISSRGFSWGMVTNGFALTEERLSNLVNSGLNSLTIALDGLTNEHNWMRGNDESFINASKAIRLAVKYPQINLEVVTCVNQRNFVYLESIKGYLAAIGVKRWRMFTAFPAGKAAGNKELQLESPQLRQLMEFIKEQRKEGTMDVCYSCEGFLGKYEGEVRDSFFMCRSGISVGSLRSNGDISGCLSVNSRYAQGNIYEGDEFMDIWNTCFIAYRDRKWMHSGICTHCKVFRYCRGNGMHLRGSDGKLMLCNYYRLNKD